jgi:hypothetical protein
MKALSKTALIAVLAPLSLSAQQKPVPFRINLLPGYHLKQTRGIDTRTGEISKFGGLLIQYDMGVDLPSAEPRNIKPVREWRRQCAWREDGYSEPKLDTGDVLCWIDVDENKKTLMVWFPDLTTFWTRVKNQRQIDVALKMLLTYDPEVQPN